MRIDISSLKDDPGASRKVSFSAASLAGLEWQESVIQSSVVQVTATVTNTGSAFVVNGEASTDLELQCDRCLKRFRYQLVAQLDEEYLPDTSLENADDASENGADEQFAEASVFRGDEIDMTEAVREQLLLALPLKALCTLDCLGLCSTCGKDLNSGECSCRQETTDPRWADLARLLDQQTDRGNV
ncbi:MAG: YceD family protein [Limnochordia bacterium]|jgi:uncharacterized protein